MSAAENKAVFLSYASQDAEAAKRICDALRQAGVEVWFDQSELVGGDAWDQKIRGQIKECALFVPMISANTQSRTEGYFRREWKLSVERTNDMADHVAFLLPVVLDATTDRAAHVPDKFREVQWTRLPGGETPAAFCERVKRLLTGGGRDASPRRPPSDMRETSGRLGETSLPGKPSRPWLMPAIFGVVAVAILALWQPWKIDQPVRAEAKPMGAQSIPVSDAQKLVAQAQKVFENSDELDRENLYLAEDLVKRALVLDPAEPSAWELAARLSYSMVWYNYENTEARRGVLQQQAARARALAPESGAAQLVFADAQLALTCSIPTAAKNLEDLSVIERDMLALAGREPENWRVQLTLGQVYRFAGRRDESLRSFQRALELSGGDPVVSADLVNVLLRRKQMAEAESVVASALARHPTGRLRLHDVNLKTLWRGDLAGARTALATWPSWILQSDRGAFLAWQTWLWSRQPERALAVAQGPQRDYLRDSFFSGPRAVLTARAHELAGHTEAARTDWRTVVQLADRELTTAPEDSAAMYWKAWALARLGDGSGARAIGAQLQQRNLIARDSFFSITSIAPLWVTLGQLDLAVDELRARSANNADNYAVTRAMLELDPAYEPLRSDPRYPELLESALAPEKKFAAAQAPKADDKSVAVLAFANLSDDKGNEYFSDGISEELLNVLAKISGLKVSARTSAFYFKGKEVPIPEIAKQLGVAYVVEGSVRKAGDKVRITAQLIKAADGFHVWSDTFTRDLKDVFAVQDEIAGLIAKNLELKMGMVAARPTVDLEAYQEYLTGKALFAKATMPDLREAVTHLERAVAIDPKFAAAWVQLASTHTRLGRWGGVPTRLAWPAARAAVDKARALEPDSPDMLVALGWILRTADWDWRGAEQAFRRALELRPNHAETLAGAAVLLFNVGKSAEAFQLAQRAAQLDPLNAGPHIDLGLMFYFNHNWAEAERAARRALQLAPGGVSYHSVLGWSLMKQKRYDEAEKEIALEASPIERIGAMGLLAIDRGQTATVRQCLDQLEVLAQANPDAADLQTSIAWLSAGLGDKERAFVALEHSRASRDPSVAWMRNGHYLLSKMYSDPRWDALLHKVGLADDQLK